MVTNQYRVDTKSAEVGEIKEDRIKVQAKEVQIKTRVVRIQTKKVQIKIKGKVLIILMVVTIIPITAETRED